MSSRFVSPSDLRTFVLCQRQYYLERVLGLPASPEGVRRRARGNEVHRAFGTSGDRARWLRRFARLAALIALLLFLWFLLAGAAWAQDAPWGVRLAEVRPLAPLAVAIVAFALFGLARLLAVRAGLPVMGEIIALDLGEQRGPLLRDERLGLSGRPDGIYRRRFGLFVRSLPVEVKSTWPPLRLYPWDEVQAAAYAMLLRARDGRRAAWRALVLYVKEESPGTVRVTGSFPVVVGRSLRRRVLAAAEGVRRARTASDVHRSHRDPKRCATCPMLPHCAEALTGRGGLGGARRSR